MKLGISPRTVYRYKDLKEPPPRQTYTTRASVLDPYVPYLLSRWEEGCPATVSNSCERDPRERLRANSERTFIRFTGQGCDVQRGRQTAVFLCTEGQERLRSRTVSYSQERGGSVHATRREALRGAEGVPAETVLLRRNPGRCPSAYTQQF
jgi:hypothetical protein